MVIKFERGNDQRRSPFFTKLYPEIRHKIFVELYGGSNVHIIFVQSAEGSTEKGARKHMTVFPDGATAFAESDMTPLRTGTTKLATSGAACHQIFCSFENGRDVLEISMFELCIGDHKNHVRSLGLDLFCHDLLKLTAMEPFYLTKADLSVQISIDSDGMVHLNSRPEKLEEMLSQIKMSLSGPKF
ncbi:hypothetical protein F53441_1917 [Fusarium austroafricanum]|uniref:Uncharacterized protein n=1 Tax=Fusarium austroafricanum TaxID=2364996 RepID=A0A8H4P4I2_9HYPO|nr:hypothetical protein F53441_1917 [Fusarium austroafricanum]